MKNHILILIAVVILGNALIVSCGGADEGDTSGKLQIVATTSMVGDLVSNIGGDAVSVTSLMGPGTDPHLYRASAGDVTALQSAEVIFLNGLHLEAKMGEVLERMGERRPVFAVAETIDEDNLLIDEDSVVDPHIWFDVELWRLAAAQVALALSEVSPEKAQEFQERYEEYDNALVDLHNEVIEDLSTIPEDYRILITSHDAFNYFGRAYGFEVLGLQGISTVSETGTKDIQNFADLITQRKIPAIFTESSVSDRSIKALQAAVQDRGWNVRIGEELFSDAMGEEGTVEGTYVGMVRHNVAAIVEAFGKQE